MKISDECPGKNIGTISNVETTLKNERVCKIFSYLPIETKNKKLSNWKMVIEQEKKTKNMYSNARISTRRRPMSLRVFPF